MTKQIKESFLGIAYVNENEVLHNIHAQNETQLQMCTFIKLNCDDHLAASRSSLNARNR